MENLTPAMKQWKKIKDAHPDKVILFRMGDFYEMFGNDAINVSRDLQLALTTRERDSDNPMPMCGVPHHALSHYAKRLLDMGYRLAIVEQLEDPKTAKGLIKRDVTRILTRGTIIEDEILEGNDANYTASIYTYNGKPSLAIGDCSTGDLNAGTFPDFQSAKNTLYAFSPAEVIIAEGSKYDLKDFFVTECPANLFVHDNCLQKINEIFNLSTKMPFGISEPGIISALGSLISYFEGNQHVSFNHLSPPRTITNSEHLIIDESTMKNLEIFEPIDKSRGGKSLFSIIDLTISPMGKRALKGWLAFPLKDKAKIKERLEAVDVLFNNPLLRAKVRKNLKHLSDISRISSRIGMNLASPRDLAALRESLALIPVIISDISVIEDEGAQRHMPFLIVKLLKQINPLPSIYDLLKKAIADEPSQSLNDGGVIRNGFDDKMDSFRNLSENAKGAIIKEEIKERERSGIPNLKIRYNRVFGYSIEVPHSQKSKVPPDYTPRQTLTNAERYITETLKSLEAEILNASESLKTRETEIFNEVVSSIKPFIKELQETASAIGEIDSLFSLAEAANRNNYVKPVIVDEPVLQIEEGRHPIIEEIMGRQAFVPNSISIDAAKKGIFILTGPNMGGKSTLLRQCTLISLLAHAGSFVPARKAVVGLCDRIFSRIGASDNLAQGLSTFMNEMTEVAAILNNATTQSLIILDEVGRGTATYDGLAIAWAVIEAIHNTPHLKGRVLFATHYHELTDLAESLKGICNVHMEVREYEGSIIFLKSMAEGPSDRSYGIHVAKLAGIPDNIIKRAADVLSELENERRLAESALDVNKQPLLFKPEEPEKNILIERLKAIDIDNLTPMEALNTLHKIIEEAKKNK